MKTLSFRASDNFMDKYNEILSLEEQEECPLKKSEIFDEMINLYYARKVLGENTEILGEEIDRMMKDNLSMFSERIAVMVNSVHGVMDEINGEQYLRIFLLGLPFLSLYNFEAAIFRSCGDGKTPLYSLVAANIVNIVLDLLSVLVFDFGLAGVVWATVIAFAVNSLILLALLCRTTDRIRLERHHMRFSREELHHIIRIGLPAGIQGMVFALSNVLIQSALNSLGTEAMAASAAAFIIEGNIYCFVNGFSQATTTFVGQNYGARNLRRCFRITKVAFGVEAAFLLVVTVPVLFFSPELIRLFNGDPNVVALGTKRLFYVAGTFYLNGIIDIISGSLRGYGYSLPPAVVVLVGICGVRITWLYTVFAAHRDFLVLMAAYPASWLVTAIVLTFVYQSCRKHIVRGLLSER